VSESDTERSQAHSKIPSVTGGRNGVKACWVDDESERPSERIPLSNRRTAERIDVTWSVDCETEDTFLYASIANISEMGIFVSTREPLQVGTELTLRFAPPGARETFVLNGQVQWINPVRLLSESRNPGMGIRFMNLSAEERERLVDTIRTIAYVRDGSN
jgi:type IV pilus assembly protein PilZ